MNNKQLGGIIGIVTITVTVNTNATKIDNIAFLSLSVLALLRLIFVNISPITIKIIPIINGSIFFFTPSKFSYRPVFLPSLSY